MSSASDSVWYIVTTTQALTNVTSICLHEGVQPAATDKHIFHPPREEGTLCDTRATIFPSHAQSRHDEWSLGTFPSQASRRTQKSFSKQLKEGITKQSTLVPRPEISSPPLGLGRPCSGHQLRSWHLRARTLEGQLGHDSCPHTWDQLRKDEIMSLQVPAPFGTVPTLDRAWCGWGMDVP